MALARLLGYNDPSKKGMPYLNEIPGQIKPYYEPYSNAGQTQLNNLQGEFGQLTQNPGVKLNEIGGGYQQSPGFKFALQQALQSQGHAAAAGGMAGSPQHEQLNAGVATNLANQDYQSWLQHALGLYGTGMEGEQDIMHQGYGAGNELAQNLGNVELNKSGLAFGGGQQGNQYITSLISALAQGAGTYMGMPAAGAAIAKGVQ